MRPVVDKSVIGADCQVWARMPSRWPVGTDQHIPIVGEQGE